MIEKQKRYGYLGTRLRGRRIEQGLSLDQLAELTGLDAAHLVAVEAGRTTITYNEFVNVAMALGSTSHEMLSPASSSYEKVVRIADYRRAK